MMNYLEKLNYKGQERIAMINADKSFRLAPAKELKKIQIDLEVDPRYPYDFMMFFVRNPSEVEEFTYTALHNLKVDGVLWFFYPRKGSRGSVPELDRNKGWKPLNDLNFFGTRLANIDDNWSALRFRSIKFIRSATGKPASGRE